MEPINNEEIIKRVSKELHDIFHGDASYLLEDKEFYDLVLNFRLKKYGVHIKLNTPSSEPTPTILEKLKSWMKGDTPEKITEGKDFDSMSDAFLYIFNNKKNYQWYKMLSSTQKKAFRDTAYQIKKESVGVSSERIKNLLNDYFIIEEKFSITEKNIED